jgi:hypothetical protein
MFSEIEASNDVSKVASTQVVLQMISQIASVGNIHSPQQMDSLGTGIDHFASVCGTITMINFKK